MKLILFTKIQILLEALNIEFFIAIEVFSYGQQNRAAKLSFKNYYCAIRQYCVLVIATWYKIVLK